MADQHSLDSDSPNPLWYPALTPPVDLGDDRQLHPQPSFRASDTPSLATPDSNSTSPETPVDLPSVLPQEPPAKLFPARQIRSRPHSWGTRFSSAVHSSLPASFTTPPIPSPLVSAAHPSSDMVSHLTAAHMASSLPFGSAPTANATSKSQYANLPNKRHPPRRDSNESPSSNTSNSTSVPNKRTRVSTEDDKRQSFLERNRQAACKSRQKKKDWIHNLERHAEELTAENHQLQLLVTALQSEVRTLRENYESHRTCWPSNSIVQQPPPPQQPQQSQQHQQPPQAVNFDSFTFNNPLDTTIATNPAQTYPTPTPESSASSASSSRNLPSLMDALARSASEQYQIVAPQSNPANPTSAVAAAAAAAAQNTLSAVYDNLSTTTSTQMPASNHDLQQQQQQQQNLSAARHLRTGSFDFESLLNSERMRSPLNDLQLPPNSAPFQYDFLQLQTPTPERLFPAAATGASLTKTKSNDIENLLPVRACSAPPTTPGDGRVGPVNSYFEPKQVKLES